MQSTVRKRILIYIVNILRPHCRVCYRPLQPSSHIFRYRTLGYRAKHSQKNINVCIYLELVSPPSLFRNPFENPSTREPRVLGYIFGTNNHVSHHHSSSSHRPLSIQRLISTSPAQTMLLNSTRPCYTWNGSQTDYVYTPCNLAAAHSMCCPTLVKPGEKTTPTSCLPNGLCSDYFNDIRKLGQQRYWIGACSDRSWQVGVCAGMARYFKPAPEGLGCYTVCMFFLFGWLCFFVWVVGLL